MFGGFSSCLIEDDESNRSQTTNECDNETNSGEDIEGNDCHNDQPTTKKAKKSSDPTNNRTQKFRDAWNQTGMWRQSSHKKELPRTELIN